MEDDSETGFQDKRVINLAADVSEAPDNVVPRLLLQVQAILDSYPQGSKQLLLVKLEIWKYELLQVAVTCLKQDFNKLLDGWNTAGKLVSILSQACVGLHVDPPESQTYYGVFIPGVIESQLKVARKLQNKYIKTSDVLEDTKAIMLNNFRIVLDAVSIMFSGHDFTVAHTLKSPGLLQLLLTDDVQTAVSVMSLIQSANRLKEGVHATLDENVIHQILDELIYKLSSSSAPEIGSGCCRTLNVICDSHSPTVELLCTRYKGLQMLLKKWSGKGIGRDLRRLQTLLDAGSMAQAELQKQHQAARIIQALFKSKLTRNKLKRADTAMSKFQKSFREKRMSTMKQKEEEKAERELEHMLLLHRRKAMRDLRKKQLEALDILPAAEVAKFLERESDEMAIKIQARWRGYIVRKNIYLKKDMVTQVRSAVTIQRSARKWMDRLRAKKKEPPAFQRPPGLTDDRRVDLQAKIKHWRDTHEVQTPKEEREDMHEKVQGMIRRHCASSKLTRKKHMHREAILARLEMDASLMLNAPKVTDIDESQLPDFVSHSVPIATKARHNHNEEIRLLKQPWWKKLGDEYQDKKIEEEKEDWKVF